VKLILHAQTSNALNSCVISIGRIETALLSINTLVLVLVLVLVLALSLSLSLGLSLGLS
jgi:hypothetical protein